MAHTYRFLFVLLCIFAVLSFSSGDNTPTVTETTFSASIDDFKWVGDPRTAALVITTDRKLHRSNDGGKAWTDITQQLAHGDGNTRNVKLLEVDTDGMRLLAIGQSGASASQDGGLSFSPVNLAPEILSVRFHPTERQWFMVSVRDDCPKNCNYKIYVTQDFGITFTAMASYVTSFEWGVSAAPTLPKETIFACSQVDKRGVQDTSRWDSGVNFVRSDDFFQSNFTMVPGGYIFAVFKPFFFVARVTGAGEQTEVHLYVSRDGLGFRSTRFPIFEAEDRIENGYSILDTSEGAAFVHVNHNHIVSQRGDLYLSDADGDDYQLTLENVRRGFTGSVDFAKIMGVEGIYIANTVDRDNFDATRTVITLNKGASWRRLAAPVNDSEGTPLLCNLDEDCSLHLHGNTARLDRVAPLHSSANAPGLIIASGNVGDELVVSGEYANAYLSRDGGVTWFEVMKGSCLFEFADHGALTLMAPLDMKASTVKYSWNQGYSWTDLSVVSTPITFEKLLTRPSQTAQDFCLIGSRWDDQRLRSVGVLIHVDFSTLQQRQCVRPEEPNSPSSDYEVWIPSDGDDTEGVCLLGHEISYVRRKRLAECYNPVEKEASRFVKHCQCREQDWECDFGFIRAVESGPELSPCVPEPGFNVSSLMDPPENCVGTYNVTRGYRRIPGDTCVGGVQHPRDVFPCPDHPDPAVSHGGVIAVVVILLLAVIVGGIILFLNRQKVRDWIEGWGPQARTDAAVRYNVLAGEDEERGLMSGSEDDDNVDEDATVMSVRDVRAATEKPAKTPHESSARLEPMDVMEDLTSGHDNL